MCSEFTLNTGTRPLVWRLLSEVINWFWFYVFVGCKSGSFNVLTLLQEAGFDVSGLKVNDFGGELLYSYMLTGIAKKKA